MNETTIEVCPGVRVYCPFQLTVDTDLADRVDRQVLEWIRQIGLFPGQAAAVRGFRFGAFAVMVHPDSRDEDRLMLAAENITAAFAIDDHYCDEDVEDAVAARASSRLAGVLNALETSNGFSFSSRIEHELLHDPVTASIRAVVNHAAGVASAAQLGRLRGAITNLCLAMAGEKGWQITGEVPSPWAYLAQRRFNGALPCLALIDVVDGYELPPEVYEEPNVRKLTLAASSLIIHVNDLYSAAKESATSADWYNLPTLLSLHNGWSLQRGAQETARMHNREMREYLRLEQTLTRGASPELSRYLTGLRNWIRGSLEWHAISGRHTRTDRPSPASLWSGHGRQ